MEKIISTEEDEKLFQKWVKQFKASKILKEDMLKGHTIGISSRRMGTVDENNKVNYEKITEYGVINCLDELKNSKQ